MSWEPLKSRLKSLVSRFEANKYHYLSKNYLEEEVKIDFINPFFEALGWDIRNIKGLSPYERDVVVEKGETIGRPDYNFRTDGQTKFFIEAKAPHEPLHKIKHVLQAKSYAWNTKNVFIVLLTDFEEFRLFDATIKPDPKNPNQGLIFELKYDQYLDNLDKLILLSKEEVEKGSLDTLILKDSLSKRLRKPVDEVFLEDISKWREELAKDIYKQNIKELEDKTDEKKVKIQVKILNEAVQKILDRLIFIRIAEDRKIIEPKSLLDEVEWWKAGGKRRDLHKRLIDRFTGWNQDFNGEILKPGPCDVLKIDSHLLAKIIEGLYFPKCPYLFDVIGVELLGSIYERYLGKTIRVTPKRVRIEEKPEVRKSGGIYYTPQYIVDHIVKNTVGKKIKGKSTQQIEKIKILDPACGSGSFLLSAYQTLIDYHLDYYERHPEESGKGTLFPDVIIDFNGTKRLSIEKKVHILRNNIFGVDIDPQAVEIAMMSLYLKCLQGERDLPQKKELLPSLAKNIRCGNSLISYDIFDQLTLFEEEEKDRINPFDWYSNETGFGQIMETGGFDVVLGNPPYVRQETIGEKVKTYFKNKFETFVSTADLYVYFIEESHKLLKKNGLFGFICSNKFIRTKYGKLLRKYLKEKVTILYIIDFGELPVFQKAATFPSIILTQNKTRKNQKFIYAPIKRLDFRSLEEEVKITEKKLDSRSIEGDNWSLATSIEIKIFERMKNNSLPLGNYVNNKIYRGILTGLNDAFVIDEETKDLLIKKSKKSIEIIKPFITGNDIRRYITIKNTKYLIFARRGIKISDYPAIENYLLQFKERLMPKPKNYSGGIWKGRKPGSYHWYEIQDTIGYYREFEKAKIIFPDIAKESRMTYDLSGLYVGNTAYIIPTDDLYLLGILNSKLIYSFFKRIATVLGDPDKRGRLRWIYQDVVKIPIKKIDFCNPKEKTIHDKIVKLAEKMLELNIKMHTILPSSKKERIERETKITDEKIDDLVYELYEITKEERKIIEEEI